MSLRDKYTDEEWDNLEKEASKKDFEPGFTMRNKIKNLQNNITVKELKKILSKFEDTDEIAIYVPYCNMLVSMNSPNIIVKK